MTFTQDVKRELSAVAPVEAHCRRAELSGLLFAAGTFEVASGDEYTVRVSLALPAVVRRLLSLLRPLGVEAELRTVDTPPTGLRYEVVLGDSARHLQVLNETGVLTDAFRVQWTVPPRIVSRRCCATAFVRGMFLGCGSISRPGRAVHAEFTLEDRELADALAALLKRLELPFQVLQRERNVACYSKRGETAADLLAMLGAHDARLRWEEEHVVGSVRETANRLANCDQANAERAARAASRQLDAARAALADARFATLPPALRVAAELRLKYPYLSLAELARKARPPLSRVAMGHRLRRLEAVERGWHEAAGDPSC